MNHFAFHIALAESKRRLLAPARLDTRRQTVTIIFAALLAVGLTALTGYQVARRKRVEIALRKTEDRARLMSMLRQIALSASRAASVREALQEALPPVLEYTRWPLAAAWTVDTWDDRERLIFAGLHAGTAAIDAIDPPAQETNLGASNRKTAPSSTPMPPPVHFMPVPNRSCAKNLFSISTPCSAKKSRNSWLTP